MVLTLYEKTTNFEATLKYVPFTEDLQQSAAAVVDVRCTARRGLRNGIR